MTSSTLRKQVDQLDVKRVDCRPVIRSYMQKLNLIGTINEMLPTEMNVEPGVIIAGMIQDTFSGRSPLYRLQQFFAAEDTELLLGKHVDSEVFADHNVGRVMDRIYEFGASRMFSKLSRHAAMIYELDLSVGHWDSTSVSVWGDYRCCDVDNDQMLKITHGHSNDHRPDLKQFLLQMLCV